ncbi:hypothetical protein ACWDYJ_01125 [Streptomyces sp. NPDC003042]
MRTGTRAALTLTLCCTAAAALTGCGGPARDGYVAVGAAAPGPERGAGENVAPQGRVEFQPLAPPLGPPPSGAGAPAGSATSAAPPGGAASTSTPPGGTGSQPSAGSGSGSTSGPALPAPTGGTPGTPDPGTPAAPVTPGAPAPKPGTTAPVPPPPTTPAPPATAAQLSLSTPTRAAASDRWCERVTVTFANTGGTAARSGTVSFATHIIGALGIDWATITTTQALPAPIAGGTSKTQTYTVCVDAWRVPLGMRVETRRVTATWN